MNKRAVVFVVLLLAAAAICLAGVSQHYVALSLRDATGLVTFVGLGILAEALALDFQVGTKKTTKSSVAFLPLFACGIIFPGVWTVLAGLVIVSASDLIVRRRALWIAAFNSAQYVIALTLATTVYTAAGGTPITVGTVDLLAFAALAFAYFATNLLIVAAFITLRTGRNLILNLHEMVGPTGGNLFYDLLASPIAVFAAWLYARMYVGGVLLVILPLLLVRSSYLLAARYRRVNKDLLRVLIKAIETRDPYTSGHSVRVSSLAKEIAEATRLPRRKVDSVETAGLLHDIGKIESLYASIISKPHHLTPSEKALIRTHPTRGADLLLELSAFQESFIIQGVRHHHERYDGEGYPDGLRGEEIPLTARIIMICDAVDAMLSDRPYRPALDTHRVRDELLRCSGEQFDPALVRVVLERGLLERAEELVRQERPGSPFTAAAEAVIGSS